MELEDYGANPFSSDGLWRLSKFSTLALQPLESLPWNDELPDLTGGFFKGPLNIFDGDDSSLRQVPAFRDDSIESDLLRDSATDESSEAHGGANVDNECASDSLEDIWSPDLLNDGSGPKFTLRSWESYQDPYFREPISAYFSESGARGFDAALAHKGGGGSRIHGRIVRNDAFFQAAVRLGLGWSSMFFRFNGQKGIFERIVDDVRVSGVSLPAINSLIEDMLQCGTDMQRVRTFVDNNPAKSNGLSASSTFSGAAAAIMYALEKHVARSSAHAMSLLQIKTLFQRPGELVGALTNILGAIQGAASDAEVISTIFGKVAYLCQKFAWMESLLYEVAVCVAEPWIKFVEAWVGLCVETPLFIDQVTSDRSFAALEYLENRGRMELEPSRVDYNYRPKQMPSFIPASLAELIFETGRSLRLLKRSHPRHPIANGSVLRRADPPGLHCTATWADIERIQDRAYEYEAKLRDEILKYNLGNTSGQETQREAAAECPEDETKGKTIAHTFELFDPEDKSHVTGLLSLASSTVEDKLYQLLDEFESSGPKFPESNFGPELASTLYLSLAPVISSQALLVDFSCLHLLFKEHRIRHHLALQWRFQLLGDGYFTSRLSQSLFDPGMESGERKSGSVLTGVHTGLRLGSRDTWPPASSELRLVLMGLLTECYFANHDLKDSESIQLDKERELPGGLSFAIRALSEEEIAKYKDSNAVEALDFLRLQYKPPAVLETIITRRSLDKYDRLFKHQLRLTRMVSVVNGLVRDSTARGTLSGDMRNKFQKFRIDSQRFVLALSDYCFHIGVGSTWQRLQDTLSRIEYCLDRGDIDSTVEAAHSVPWLRRYHEDILDQMLFALFLSRRHAQAATLLENIFSTILTFAPLSRMDGISGVRHESETTVTQLYAVFRKQTSAFVDYLRSLDPGKASSKSLSRSNAAFTSPMDSTSVFEHLLVRLDIKRYY